MMTTSYVKLLVALHTDCNALCEVDDNCIIGYEPVSEEAMIMAKKKKAEANKFEALIQKSISKLERDAQAIALDA